MVEEKEGMFLVGIVGIIAIVGLLVMVINSEYKTDYPPQSYHPMISHPSQESTNQPAVSSDSNIALSNRSSAFPFEKMVLKDSLGNEVNLLIYKGNQSIYEPIVFSMGLYGDHTVTGFRSLKEYGAGTIEAGAYSFNELPSWAKSPLSAEADEHALNVAFRQHLINIGILSKDYDLVKGQEGSILFFMNDKNEAQDITHESSHALYNNIPQYETAANQVFDSLNQDKKTCITTFLQYNQININDSHVLHDEATAYMTDGTMNICLGNFTEDINNDSIISSSEQYVWDTIQLLRHS